MQVAYPRIASQLFGTAHAIEPGALRALLEGPAAKRILAAERPSRGPRVTHASKMQRLFARVSAERVPVDGDVGEYFLTTDGVAIVPVYGVLSRRFDWLTSLCGWTTYEGLAATLDAVLADSRVRAVLLDVESPGGECAGLLDISDAVLAARSIKPVWAVANDFAASAAYAIAGSAERLVLPRLGQVGSIGAMMVHLDDSDAVAAAGLKYTAIFSGERKMDGWEHARLEPEARAALKARVDHCRDEFAALVGRQGRITMAEALSTEAAMYSDVDAVDEGLADEVMTFEEALAELSELVASGPETGVAAASRAAPIRGERTMSKIVAKAKKAETADDEGEEKDEDAPTGKKTASKKAETADDEGDDKDEDAPTGKKAAKSKKAETADDEGDDKDEDAPTGKKSAKSKKAETDDDKEPKASSVYTAAMMQETIDLCAIAGMAAEVARAFVTAQTPIAKVRSELMARQAEAADKVALDATAPKSVAANSGWDDAIAKVNAQNGHAKKS